MFSLQELLDFNTSANKKKRVGFVIPEIGFYNKVTASTRIKVYDVIKAFRTNDHYRLELYNRFRKYDMVIFLKTYGPKAFKLAGQLKRKGTKVVFDININVFESGSSYVSKEQTAEATKFASLCDVTLTNSPYTKRVLNEMEIAKEVRVIHEAISDDYFQPIDLEKDSEIPVLLWVGYAEKAKALDKIKPVLLELSKELDFKIRIISEKDPKLDHGSISLDYKPYKHQEIVKELKQADAFIAPRDLTDPYNRGHSFTKIGIAMAAGLPVFASPVPSYINSPAILCKNNEDWLNALGDYLKGEVDKQRLREDGVRYCSEMYGMNNVKASYEKLFNDFI